MGGSKKKSMDLEVSAVQEDAGRGEAAAVRSKSSKKRKNDTENGELGAEKMPEGKKKKKRERQNGGAEAEPPENTFTEKDAENGILEGNGGRREKKKKKKKKDEEEEEEEVVGGSSGAEIPKKKKKKGKGKHRDSIEIETGNYLNDLPSRNAPNELPDEANPVRLETDNSKPCLAQPELHMDVFRNLSSADGRVREDAALSLGKELQEVQEYYERCGMKDRDGEGLQLEAAKDDCLKDCAPTLRYALRRLIRGVSSSRACARQGFALAFATVVGTIPCIKLEALVKLIEELLEVTSSMKGQDYLVGLHQVQIGPIMIYYTFCIMKDLMLHTKMKEVKFKDRYSQGLLQEHHYRNEAKIEDILFKKISRTRCCKFKDSPDV